MATHQTAILRSWISLEHVVGEREQLLWSTLPELPTGRGLGGPYAGLHHEALIAAGGIGTAVALLLAAFDISPLFFLFQKVLGLISSGLVGIFILGIFTRHSHATGVLIGAAASFAVLFICHAIQRRAFLSLRRD